MASYVPTYYCFGGENMPRINVDEELVTKLEYVRSNVAFQLLKKNKKLKKITNTDIINEALNLYAEKHDIPIE